MDPSHESFTIDELGAGRFILSGELDLATAPQLSELADVHGPILDLRHLAVIDASGVAASCRSTALRTTAAGSSSKLSPK
jgi:hypothetical protein